MKILRNFSIFCGKDQNMLDKSNLFKFIQIYKFPDISERKLSHFSENEFQNWIQMLEKARNFKVRKKLELEQNSF